MSNLNALLEKTSHWDKDERYMATNDIITEMSKDVKIDEAMERKICSAVLKQLDDQSNDVQSVAIKCLSILFKKVKQTQIGEITEKLITLIIEGKDQLRDIYSIGLKTLINDVPDDMGILVCQKTIAKLLHSISNVAHDEVKRECIDILSDLIKRFGYHLDLSEVTRICIQQLENSKQIQKKRLANTLGSVATVCSDNLLHTLVESIIQKVNTTTIQLSSFSYVQTLSLISRSVGYRLTKLVVSLIPIFIQYCGHSDDENQQNDEMNDIRDYCFIGIEALVLKCGRDISTIHIEQILTLALIFMQYDPNYAYDEEEEEDTTMDSNTSSHESNNNEEEEEDEYGAEEEDDDNLDQGSDYEDNSWKVRKNAVKVIHALLVVSSSSSAIVLSQEQLKKITLTLLHRMKEREENVRIDIITAYTELITVIYSSSTTTTTTHSAKYQSLIQTTTTSFMNIISKYLNHSSSKTKLASFSLLHYYLHITKMDVSKYIPGVIDSIKSSIYDKNQMVRLESLQLLRSIYETQSSIATSSYIQTLLPVIQAGIESDWYKMTIESLKIIHVLFLNLLSVPTDQMSIDHSPTPTSTPLSQDTVKQILDILYPLILPKFTAQDLDVEIKELSISMIGQFISQYNGHFPDQIPQLLSLLKSKLDHEITRIYALKAIIVIAKSQTLSLDINSYFLDILKDISPLLSQQNRSLKQLVLKTIDAILESKKIVSLDDTVAITMKHQVSTLMHDNDVQLCTMGIQTFMHILTIVPLSQQPLDLSIYQKLVDLAASSTLHSNLSAQATFLSFLSYLMKIEGGPSYTQFLSDFKHTTLAQATNKRSIACISKCISTIILSKDPTIQHQFIEGIISDLNNSETVEAVRVLALLSLGELGQDLDLQHYDHLSSLILSYFNHTSESITSAAAYALASLAAHNPTKYLSVILNDSADAKHKYLLLLSLKELTLIITTKKYTTLDSHIPQITPYLIQYCTQDDENLRGLVAECLGVLCYLQPTTIIPILSTVLHDSVNTVQVKAIWTIVTAYKHAITRPVTMMHSDVFTPLAISIQNLISTLKPLQDIEVKKAVILLIHVILHHHPEVILSYVNDVIQCIIEGLAVKAERTVDLGPFKHKVDDGLPVRKNALRCVEEFISSFSTTSTTTTGGGTVYMSHIHHFLDLFIPIIPTLLNDVDEIKLQVNQILLKIIQSYTPTLSNAIESLIEPYDKIYTKNQPKEGMQPHDIEKLHEITKSCTRVILSIQETCSAYYDKRWSIFYDKVMKNNYIVDIVNTIKNDKLVK